VGTKLGKYRLERRLAAGPFANVYRAMDTIEGARVALKIAHPHLMSKEVLDDFRNEVRLIAQFDHPNILTLKNASFIDSHFVIAFPLGERTLADRMQSRMALRTVIEYAEQMLDAVAYAHAHRVIHCDIKPENFILFPGDRLRLTDFGISLVAQRTVQGSGWGTMGYVAPEQAMGKPSFRSDVFSLGLVLYRMLAGRLPEWPYDWPPPGYERLRGRVHPDLIAFLRKAIEFNSRDRFEDGEKMQSALGRIKPRALRYLSDRSPRKTTGSSRQDWQAIRRRQFQQQYGKLLETRYTCHRCQGPVAEAMHACPWCGADRAVHRGATRFPAHCPRCSRGLKLDWRFCPWCYGPGFETNAERQYSDVRYEARCSNPNCTRKLLMPFMRYCPWCRRKVRRKWKLPGSRDTCASCGWGVFASFWDYCPWCGKSLRKR
jgi:serine/threonine-protein kinase